jgi:glycosyltransferase involved in cell wall biosynthesis
MPLISIVTAVHASGAEYLADTAGAIAAIRLPRGWDLEWIVQEDGDRPELAGRFAGLTFPVSYAANGHQYGTALTRNLALTRASGVLVQALDQDDVLLPNVFMTLIPRFTANRIHWAIGQADDLMPDGTRRPYPSPIPFGLMRAGYANARAADDGGNWPIHAAALMMRTATLRALGGWTALPYDDELATFAAMSEVADGWYDRVITWLYRHHDRQLHRTPAAQALSATGRRVAMQRAQAAAAAGLRFGDDAADGFAVVNGDVHVGELSKDTTLPGELAGRRAAG